MKVFIINNLIYLGLIANLIGTILLSIPTVDGIKYITPIILFFKKYFEKFLILIGSLLIIWFILHFFGLDLIYILPQLNKQNSSSFIDIALIIYKPLIYLLSAILIIGFFTILLTWLSADKEHQKEKEKRIGALGISFILFGFILQIIDTALTR